MDTLKTSRTSAHGRSLEWRGVTARSGRRLALAGALGKWRARPMCGAGRNKRPPEMRGQAQRFVAEGRRPGPGVKAAPPQWRPARSGAAARRRCLRRGKRHACRTNELTQLKNRTGAGVTNITFQVSPQRGGSRRAMVPLPSRTPMHFASRPPAETNDFEPRRSCLRRARQRAGGVALRNCKYTRGSGFAASKGRHALPQTFVRMKTADGHWGTTGQQPVRELAIDMPARPARSTGEQ